jgi:Domain of unknown function (DUF5664)
MEQSIFSPQLGTTLKPLPPLSGVPAEGALKPLESGNTKSSFESDPHGIGQHEPGAKVDAGKQLSWLFISGFATALGEVAEVTTFGARKYTPNGWKAVPDGSQRYMEAFGRHLFALGRGEVRDNGPGGTGCYHKAQMIWNLLASLELDLKNGT